jgi:hypothetical protein
MNKEVSEARKLRTRNSKKMIGLGLGVLAIVGILLVVKDAAALTFDLDFSDLEDPDNVGA